MGLILDTSVLVADERKKFDMVRLLQQYRESIPVIAAITVSELLHGVERAKDSGQRLRRQRHVEDVIASLHIEPFDLTKARCHAKLWAGLESKGQMIGSHDLQIAATAIASGHDLATLNVREFQRVHGLKVVDATEFLILL